ncbi:MAG: helix-turn-helix domain-containing protein [Phreatobacter sp.]|uniref:IclR family transcriptional regulator n=1 Tax=Phreatobacter sp. TaxID=1966341 RepID=UPI001A5F8F2E|nr:IclR family transcriptional regulator C-terminal domain-containing protein [Phreatobacter sp.]MBL8570261.1 helix-turn-helix domain-containing protein [Phreatobacter sp.]
MTSLAKMLRILELFEDDRSNFQLDDAVAATGASRATVYRYLQVLSASGLIAPATGGSFVLGSKIIELDRLVRKTDPLSTSARPIMEAVSARLGLNMLLCSYYGDKVMCAEIVWPDHSVRPAYERGRKMPMFHGAMAKLILAHLTPYQLRNMMLWHADEIRAAGLGDNWEEFRQAMARIRKEGSCVTRGEVVEGLVGIGAPIFDPDRRILGSIVFAVPEHQLVAIGEPVLRAEIIAIAAQIDAAIAHHVPAGTQAVARSARPRRGPQA